MITYKKTLLTPHIVYLMAILWVCGSTLRLNAQPYVTPDWIKKGGGKKMSNSNMIDITTDKHGNSYMLSNISGYITIDGHSGIDSAGNMALISWDCNGNYRWMKTFGGGSIRGVSLRTDTAEGVYVTGYFKNNSSTTTSYFDADTLITGQKEAFYILKYNSTGSLQWFKTPYVQTNTNDNAGCIDLSVSPEGNLFWLAYLPIGTHDGGAFSITIPGYYLIQYNDLGIYQKLVRPSITSTIPLKQVSGAFYYMNLAIDHTSGRFYLAFNQSKVTLGTITIGTSIYHPANNKNTAFLSCFDKNGVALWTRKSDTSKHMTIVNPVLGNNVVFIGGRADIGSVFGGDTAKNRMYLKALDTTGTIIWSSYGGDNTFSNGEVSSIAYNNNILLAAGTFYHPSVSWGNHTISTTTASNSFMARINASNGTAMSLDSINASLYCFLTNCAIDMNNNIYIGGNFRNYLQFANNTIFSSDTISNGDNYIARFKNTNCNCNLLQPNFTFTQAGTTSFSFNYTGTTPYTNISWNFGDGSPILVGNASVTHNFSHSSSSYPVCVTVTNGCGTNTTCNHIYVNISKTETLQNFTFTRIYPNPANTVLYIEGTETVRKVVISDLMGRILSQTSINAKKGALDISMLHSGIYFMQLTDKNGTIENKQFIKE